FPDPFGRAEVIEGVVAVLVHSGCDWKNIGIENDVLWREAYFVDKDVIRTPADFNAPFKAICLAMFVKGHDNGGRTVTHYLPCMLHKFLFASLQADAVYNTFSLAN